MASLRQLIPDPRAVKEMDVSDLAGYVLEALLSSNPNEGHWHRGNFCSGAARAYFDLGVTIDDVAKPCAEAWAWLESNGLICEHPEKDRGWYMVTRRGQQIGTLQNLRSVIESQQLPEHFLHPEVLVHARPLFLQGRLDTAVFEAFKALEVAIRTVAGMGADAIGVSLVNKAFHPEDGPLTDKTAEKGERVALMYLMAGAIGSYKNPSSHRRVEIETEEARDMIMLASHLLKIVDSRRPG